MRWSMYLKVTQSKETKTTCKNNFDPPIYLFFVFFFLSPIVASVII